MGKKKRKKTKNGRTPPLSTLDKVIYWFAFTVFVLLCFAPLIYITIVGRRIAFADPTVIAFDPHGAGLACVPAALWFIVGGVILFESLYLSKRPIFGSSKIRYGVYPWKPDLFPMFGPQARKPLLKPKAKKHRHRLLILWVFILLLTMSLFPLELFARDCLHNDLHITEYSLINTQKERFYTTEDYARLALRANFVLGYRSGSYWDVSAEIEMADGRRFTYTVRDFDNSHPDYITTVLDTMTEIKGHFPSDAVTIKGDQNLHKVIAHYDLDTTQAEQLRLLFTIQ